VEVAFDALELWVGDLDRMQRLLTDAFRFRPVQIPVDAPADGAPDPAICLASGWVRVILRQGRTPTSLISRHVARHGDAVADVALVCPAPAAVAERALAHGLTVHGRPDAPTIDLFGDGTVCHTVRRTGLLADSAPAMGDPRIRAVDHLGYCLPWGYAEPAARAYQDVFGLRRLDADSFDAVGDEATGMRSVVLRSGSGFTVVLTEPISRASTGQTQRFVDAHAGPGVQHAALAYDDLFAAVESLRTSGVEFLAIPSGYYAGARQRLPDLPVTWETLRRLEILVDSDHDGLLYQLFTRPIADRGTFFFELIQRAGATGFGVNNVTALFEAIQATINKDM
jgi:4-hydroxymandelate synthase